MLLSSTGSCNMEQQAQMAAWKFRLHIKKEPFLLGGQCDPQTGYKSPFLEVLKNWQSHG